MLKTVPSPDVMTRYPKLPVQMTRFDGAIWERHEIASGTMIVTSVGRTLLEKQPELKDVIGEYMAAVEQKRDSPTGVRRFIAEGNHARVYAVGNTGLAMKERKSSVADPLLPAMQRMDFLAHVIQTHCPRWIDIPQHYGVYLPDDDSGKEFMLMKKVDDGITVGDVLGAHDMPREPHIGEAVLKIFDGVSPQTHSEVKSRFNDMKDSLKEGLYKEGVAPQEFLTDIESNMYNAIVEPLPTPIAGSSYRLTIIDQ